MDSDRPIMKNEAIVGPIVLGPGEYWIDWQSDGSLESGPFAPPITINGETTTGDGVRSINNGLSWFEVVDSGTSTQQGLPFLIHGSVICTMDLNYDGQVGPADLAIVLGNWGPVPPNDPDADLNGDGLVDPADLAIVLGNWGPCF